MLAWQALKAVAGQRRIHPEVVGNGLETRTGAHVYGLDYNACLAYARAIGADNAIFFELLPYVESVIVHAEAAEYANA